jgi:hypothetical protein
MTFVADRYKTASTWILNPTFFWLGHDLQDFLQLNERNRWAFSTDYRAVLSPSIQEKIQEKKSIYKQLELTPPRNLWQLLAEGFDIPNTLYPKLANLRSPKSSSWLFRNVYSDDFLRAWLASDAIMSNEPTDDNKSYAKFIEQTLERVSSQRFRADGRVLKTNQTIKGIGPSSWHFIFISSLPELIINRNRLNSFITIDNEALYQNDGLSEVVDVDQHPSIQSVTHDLLPPTMINPDWLYTVGWYDLWAGPQSLNNPSGVVEQHDCIFCSAGKVYCGECENGQVECEECGGDYSNYCENCSEGWIECESCASEGQQLCDDCDGEGTVDCDDCDGAGNVECEECEGTAELTQCPACEGTGWEGGSSNEARDNTCGECDGEGETDAFPCPTCFEGRVDCSTNCDEDGQVECGYCDGDGQTTCTECEGDGGAYCDSYGCDEGYIYCEYCDASDDRGYQECGECEGYYERGDCPQMHYEQIWGESIDSSLQNVVTKNGRRRKLENLMANLKMLPTENTSINLLQEVYGDVKFEFKTMAEIWNKFLKVMKQESRESIYFFNPTPNGIMIQYVTFADLLDFEFTLGDLLVLTRRSVDSVYEGDTETLYNRKPRTGINAIDRQIRMKQYRENWEQDVIKFRMMPDAESKFRAMFDIRVNDVDLKYWTLFWNNYYSILEPFVNDEDLKDFEFLVGTAIDSAKIITFNYPKG